MNVLARFTAPGLSPPSVPPGLEVGFEEDERDPVSVLADHAFLIPPEPEDAPLSDDDSPPPPSVIPWFFTLGAGVFFTVYSHQVPYYQQPIEDREPSPPVLLSSSGQAGGSNVSFRGSLVGFHNMPDDLSSPSVDCTADIEREDGVRFFGIDFGEIDCLSSPSPSVPSSLLPPSPPSPSLFEDPSPSVPPLLLPELPPLPEPDWSLFTPDGIRILRALFLSLRDFFLFASRLTGIKLSLRKTKLLLPNLLTPAEVDVLRFLLDEIGWADLEVAHQFRYLGIEVGPRVTAAVVFHNALVKAEARLVQ